ncbi:MAG: PspC domain-containing protein [Bacteroidales bacterium]|nr:PspC domain-containing protein [Bacteroidales bacterium]
MKKNINVNISGLLFSIDDDAYLALQNYLDRLKHYFGTDASALEIINDIEARISEMFHEKLNEQKGVITISDVQEIIKIMGEPGEIEEETEFETPNQNNGKQQSKQTHYTSNSTGKRKLYRDPDDKVIGGVGSGLSYYFGINPIWIRLAFIALVFFGMSIIVYIILWIVIPEAKTTAQKLEMRGEPINIDNIEKSIREELNNLGDKLNDIKDKHFKKKSSGQTIFERIAGVFVSIISFAIKALLIFIGSIFAIVALALIVSLIPAFFATGSIFVHTFPGLHFISIFDVSNLLFSGVYGSKMAYVGLMLVLFIPLIAIVYQGLRLIFGYRGKSGMGVTFFIIWITGVILLLISGTQLANDMNNKATVSTEIRLDNLKQDTLYIKIDEAFFNQLDLIDDIDDGCNIQFYADRDYFYTIPRITYEQLDSNETAKITIRKKTRANRYKKAKRMAETINFPYTIHGDTLILSPLIQVAKENKWRNQKVVIELQIPEDIHIKYIQEHFDHPILNDIQERWEERIDFGEDQSSYIIDNDSNELNLKSGNTKIIMDSNGINIEAEDVIIKMDSDELKIDVN